ncbi:hypothetical protein DPMN_041349 [Dreissena polymorpha]|uniref:Uncharacterized protein n=1 Tax=Dreissena polymorpha TaxID=45954 RepID=A0A9D4D020_DREPO|nr:hypothetical protein DPMN_041349 [Dreissena polymorpha]
MPQAVESFRKAYEVEEELTLQVALNDNSSFEDLCYCAPPSSLSSLISHEQSLGLTFQSVKGDAGMTDFATIVAQLEVVIFR